MSERRCRGYRRRFELRYKTLASLVSSRDTTPLKETKEIRVVGSDLEDVDVIVCALVLLPL